MRLVLDTNTAGSGLIWGRVPGRLIDAAAAGKTQIIRRRLTGKSFGLLPTG